MNQLVHCIIAFPTHQFEISDTYQPIILPFLQSLTLSVGRNTDTSCDAAFFCCLHAPLLKDLHLVHESPNHAELVKQLAGFSARSAVSLSSLHLSYYFGYKISGEDIIPLVAVFPSIRILRVDQIGSRVDIRPLIRALTYNPVHPGPQVHLANLEELYLDHGKIEEEEVCDLIQSYWRPIQDNNTGVNESLLDVGDGTSKLRKATILDCDKYARAYVDRFTKLAHESALRGIQFRFQLRGAK